MSLERQGDLQGFRSFDDRALQESCLLGALKPQVMSSRMPGKRGAHSLRIEESHVSSSACLAKIQYQIQTATSTIMRTDVNNRRANRNFRHHARQSHFPNSWLVIHVEGTGCAGARPRQALVREQSQPKSTFIHHRRPLSSAPSELQDTTQVSFIAA